uniref:Uncharacterized protein n=1 Tax=Setaria italica TaxID=4555 RepID=K4ANA2_SETIT
MILSSLNMFLSARRGIHISFCIRMFVITNFSISINWMIELVIFR